MTPQRRSTSHIRSVKTLPPSSEWEQRFWSHVDRTDGCWLWNGATHGKGYGGFMIDGTMYLAHRLSFWLAYGKTPDNGLVCHTCDTPLCVRPDHLYLGDKSSNMLDAIARGLRTYTPEEVARGEQHAGAILTRKQVAAIRRRIMSHDGRYEDIAQDYGVSKSTVGHIATMRIWAWLPWPERTQGAA